MFRPVVWSHLSKDDLRYEGLPLPAIVYTALPRGRLLASA